jgi:hypothetical protein
MTDARTILKAAMRWVVVLVTSAVLLAPNLFAAKSIPKASGPKSCCQRCACCIESNPDQPQVPLAIPTSSRASVDQPAALPLALVAAILARPAPPSQAAFDFDAASHPSSSPIFLRNCAILI